MINTPAIRGRILPFNAKKDYTLLFESYNDVQITRHLVVIENPRTNEVVYKSEVPSFVNRHLIPADSLENGNDYQVKIKVGNATNWSEYSELNYFKCLDDATLTITNIDYQNGNKVYNQTVEFVADYVHPNNENVASFRFILYDYNMQLLRTYNTQYYNGNISESVSDLEDGKLYYLEVVVDTINEATYSSGKISFTPDYITVSLSAVVDPHNVPEMGAIKLNATLVQSIGNLYDYDDNLYDLDDIEYFDGEWIDLTRDDYAKLIFDKGFKVNGYDFTIQMWLKNIPDKIRFMTLYCKSGKLELFKYNGRLHVFKQNEHQHSKLAHFVSDKFEYEDDKHYVITLRQIGHRVDIIIEDYGGD